MRKHAWKAVEEDDRSEAGSADKMRTEIERYHPISHTKDELERMEKKIAGRNSST
jgi:hypothetical protein